MDRVNVLCALLVVGLGVFFVFFYNPEITTVDAKDFYVLFGWAWLVLGFGWLAELYNRKKIKELQKQIDDQWNQLKRSVNMTEELAEIVRKRTSSL